jgi:hypothetical protein
VDRVGAREPKSFAAAEREAARRVTRARAGYWPRVDVTESWQRGDQPVFVFSALLAQRRSPLLISFSTRSITPAPSTTSGLRESARSPFTWFVGLNLLPSAFTSGAR